MAKYRNWRLEVDFKGLLCFISNVNKHLVLRLTPKSKGRLQICSLISDERKESFAIFPNIKRKRMALNIYEAEQKQHQEYLDSTYLVIYYLQDRALLQVQSITVSASLQAPTGYLVQYAWILTSQVSTLNPSSVPQPLWKTGCSVPVLYG